MAQIIKRPFKSFNGADWDTHHFETEASQVKTAAGSDVETELATKANKMQESSIAPTLINNWINSDTANYYGAGYWKDSMGYVHIRGMIQVSTGGTDSTVPFYLPAGYRPLKSYDFSVKTNLTIPCYVRVRADGAVIVFTPGQVASHINFGEIIFRAVD